MPLQNLSQSLNHIISGLTPLEYAAFTNKPQAVRLLIANGTNIYERINGKKEYNTLFDYFQCDCFKESLTIYLTSLPIYPKDLIGNAFLIPMDKPIDTVRSIIAHELTHFYYYRILASNTYNKENLEKNDLFSEQKRWIISEMIIPFLFEDYKLKYNINFTCSMYLFKPNTLKK